MPPSTTYKSALTTARISSSRGRPPGLGGGIKSLISSHSVSVRSVGYGVVVMPIMYRTDATYERLFKQPLRSRPYALSLAPWLNVSPPQPLQRASGLLPSLLHGAQRRTRAPLLTRLQNPSGRAYPKTLQAWQENRCGASLESSSVCPLVEALLFLPRHGMCSDWEAFAVWKLDDDTEELPASRCLAEDIIHRIDPYRLGTLHQRLAKANVFDLSLLLTPPLGAERLTPRSATFRRLSLPSMTACTAHTPKLRRGPHGTDPRLPQSVRCGP